MDYPLLTLMQFNAFLVHHLPVIAPKLIVLFFNNETTPLANHVSQAISGYQQLIFNYDEHWQSQIIIPESSLLINCVNGKTNQYFKFDFDVREIYLVLAEKRVYKTIISANDLIVRTYQGKLTFSAWEPRNRNSTAIRRMDEAELVGSFAWLAFLRRANRLPEGEWINVIDDILVDSSGSATNEINPKTQTHQSRILFVSGFRIGIYMIIAERLSAKAMSYLPAIDNVDYKVQFPRLPPMQYIDKRLSWCFSKNPRYLQLSLSMKLFYKIRVYTNANPERYLILVPRIVVNSSNQVFYQTILKCMLVLVLLLTAAVLTGLRFACQWTLRDSTISQKNLNSIVKLFTDTFARSLGTSTGNWNGRTTTERQLLVVIGFFGLLSSSIFSGIFYEQLLLEDNTLFMYENLDDVCRANLNVGIPLIMFAQFLLNPKWK